MKKIKTKRLTLAKETVSLLENGNLRNLAGAGSDTCASWVTDPGSWPGYCYLIQCA
jgi:hypothetical protein